MEQSRPVGHVWQHRYSRILFDTVEIGIMTDVMCKAWYDHIVHADCAETRMPIRIGHLDGKVHAFAMGLTNMTRMRHNPGLAGCKNVLRQCDMFVCSKCTQNVYFGGR